MRRQLGSMSSRRLYGIAVIIGYCLHFGISIAAAQSSPRSSGREEKVVFTRSDPNRGIKSTELIANVDRAGNVSGHTAAPLFEPTSSQAIRRNVIGIMNPDGSGGIEFSASGSDPALSPDGTKIAYASSRDTLYSEIYVMNSDGTAAKRLTNITTGDSFGPVWSHGGNRIAFYAFALTNPSRNPEIWLMEADGTGLKRIAEHGLQPAWSPNDRQFAFTSNSDGIFQIYTMNSDGSNVRQLTKVKGESSNPAWAPDGMAIVFSSEGEAGRRALFLIGSDGSDAHRIAFSKIQDFCFPSWSPDGQNIMFTALARLGAQGIVVNEQKPRCDQWTGEYQIFTFDSGGKTHLISDAKQMRMHASYGQVLAQK
jgi:Tol biopolymer transport system component